MTTLPQTGLDPRSLTIIVNPHTLALRANPGLEDVLRMSLPSGARFVRTHNAVHAANVLPELIESGSQVIGVLGGDGTLGSLVTPLLRAGVAGFNPLLLPLCTGSTNRVAKSLGLRGMPHQIAKRALRAMKRGRVRPVERSTLRVSSSLRARPDFGFTAVFGSLYDLAEDTLRRGGARRHRMQSMVSAARGESPQADHRLIARLDRVTTGIGLARLTSLVPEVDEAVGFAVETGDGSRLGEARALLRSVMPIRGQTRYVREAIFDLQGGYALDGDLYPAETPYTVRVEVGPPVAFLAPT